MIKLSILLTVVALAFSAQASMLSLHAGNRHQVRNHQVVKPMITQSQALELQGQQLNQPKKVITSMPEGELRTYERTGGQGMFANNDQIGLDVQSGKMDIVFAEDNVVYMKNILFNCIINYGPSWVQGVLSDDGTTITVPLGQSICWDEYNQANLELCMGSTELIYVDGQPDHIEFTVDESVTEVTYIIDGDKIMLQGTVALKRQAKT